VTVLSTGLSSAPAAAHPDAVFTRPYVVSWNLTYRCNLACEHCYLDAGGSPRVSSEAFSDRSELDTEGCYAVIDQLAAFAPECLTILTGGEPLLRRDILDIIRRAVSKGLWVVVGTNGVKVTASLAHLLRDAGVRGLSLSLDALDPDRHDRFRRVRGAWQNTVDGAAVLRQAGLRFIVQTTAGAHNRGELTALAAFACERLGASAWNLYFLVPTGRGPFVSDLTAAEYDEILSALPLLQQTYRGRMLVNAKCAPHSIKTVLEQMSSEAAPIADPSVQVGTDAAEKALGALRLYAGGAGGCPAGTHYLGIRPNGDVTPCPYLPLFAGSIRDKSLQDLWNSSDLFVRLRRREALGGRCGDCELGSRCGGCRARAYGMTGDVMAEDPLCTHEPGRFARTPLLAVPQVEYGHVTGQTMTWNAAAEARMQRIPVFVRGMVVRAGEESCRSNGVSRVTLEELEKIRARMPSAGLFGAARR